MKGRLSNNIVGRTTRIKYYHFLISHYGGPVITLGYSKLDAPVMGFPSLSKRVTLRIMKVPETTVFPSGNKLPDYLPPFG
jgi:hypothetical protein